MKSWKERKMTVVYPVIITQTNDEKNTFLVEIPDLDGMTEGYGMADAIKMSRDYIGGCLFNKAEDEYPKASSYLDPEKGKFSYAGKSIVTLIDIDMDAYKKKLNSKAVRKNVSIPAWLDQRAQEEHMNLSHVLQEALMEKMNMA